uniref:Uncharacterized protein n=1 Tax=Anopheles christyi TaxID=43041 RepID=A0A182K502_9DIPT
MDRLKQFDESSSSESSSESFANNHNTEQAIVFLLEKLDMLMWNFNHTVYSLSCYKHTHFNRQAGSHVADLRKPFAFNCETSPMALSCRKK